MTDSGAKHNQGFNGPTLIAKVSVNLKFEVQRVILNLRKFGLRAANRTQIAQAERGLLKRKCVFSSP
jgi:hypothetical protein